VVIMMTLFWWSVVTSAFMLTTAWLVGSRYRWCWHFGLVTQAVMTVYFVDTGQLASLVTVGLFATLYVRNIVAWRRADVGAATCGCGSSGQ
jgi:nicotinamide riboside transporter PnuC